MFIDCVTITNIEQTLHQWEENLKSFTSAVSEMQGHPWDFSLSTQVDAWDVFIPYSQTTVDITAVLE